MNDYHKDTGRMSIKWKSKKNIDLKTIYIINNQ